MTEKELRYIVCYMHFMRERAESLLSLTQDMVRRSASAASYMKMQKDEQCEEFVAPFEQQRDLLRKIARQFNEMTKKYRVDKDI